ncbi:MAG: methylated-DNA--[Bacteroidales bacterium]|nr:methylated-DNA--[protein]-cysteine S-methyltransferase [Bacteroidales bacterium]
MVFTFLYDSPMGDLTLVSDGISLTELRFSGRGASELRSDGRTKDREICGGNSMLSVFADTCRWLDIYFAGRDPGFLPQLAPEGTPFRKEVWDLLLGIPFGETTSYGTLAAKIASKLGKDKMSAQAIGGAVGHNPIPIIIPCHRVIAADGSIGGFSAGIERKAWLLRMEGIML